MEDLPMIMFCLGFLAGTFLNQVIHDMIKHIMKEKNIWPYNDQSKPNT